MSNRRVYQSGDTGLRKGALALGLPIAAATSVDTNRRIAEAANALPLTFAGARVVVTGTRHAFATVSVADRQHPFCGWTAEYAWPTIDRATRKGGELK